MASNRRWCCCPCRRGRSGLLEHDHEVGSSDLQQGVSVTARELMVPEKCFYMNFKLLNTAKAFPKILRGKLRKAGKSDTAVAIAGKCSQLIAGTPNFDKSLSNKIADQLTGLMPQKLEENGIDLKLTKVHCGEMGFIVLRAEVVDVDLLKLVGKAKGSEFAERLAPLIGLARRFKDIDKAMVPKVQQQMMRKLETEIPALMWEKARLKLLTICKSTGEQADFFFDALVVHELEIVFELRNRAEVAPMFAAEQVRSHFGDKFGRGKFLGKFASRLVSQAVAQELVPDDVFGELVAECLSDVLPKYLADVGVTMVVAEGFAAEDQSGRTVLRCDITDVHLDSFLQAPGSADILGAIAQGQHLLKLGHRGRSEVYQAIRNYINAQVPHLLFEQKGLDVSIVVKDIAKAPAEMMDIELSDSDSSTDGTAGAGV